MEKKRLQFNSELHQTFAEGSRAVCGTVSANFGPEGRNTICGKKYDLPFVANTGRQILQGMELEDAGQNLSAALIREAAHKVAEACGDGTIATVLLTDALLRAGSRMTAAGHSPVELRRGIQRASVAAREMLGEITVPFSEVSAEKVAESTAKNTEVAANCVKAFQMAGMDGVVTVRDTQMRDTVLNLWDGIRYEYGLLNHSFTTDAGHRRALLTHPYVLLSNVKIKSLQDIRRMLEEALTSNSPLLIITNDMAEDVQRALLVNKERAGLQVVVAKAPGLGDTRRRNMLSLAAKTGSLIFDENTGRNLRDCGLEVCSRVARAEIDWDMTALQGFENGSEEMADMLRRHTLGLLSKTADPDECEKLQTTLSILNGKTAEILVGAVTEYEMFEKKYLYENTVRTLKNAAHTGVIPGAGSAYVFQEKKLRAFCADWPETERLGGVCFGKALRMLAARLLTNAGENAEVILSKLECLDDPWQGYDIVRHEYTDLRQAGILMPRGLVETILSTAAETAGSLLTASAAVIEER